MVHQYFALLPDAASATTVVVLWVVAACGAVVWAIGAKVSRPLITLTTVLLGASIGMQMPRWFGWDISGAGPAVGMAVVLGVTGFAVQGGWLGALLGLTLAVWAAFVTWVCVGEAQSMSMPVVNEFTTMASFFQEWWYQLPPPVAKFLPYTTAAAMVTGLALAILWTRLTTVLAWSLTGATLLVACGLAATQFARPHWLDGRVPGVPLQIGIMVLIVLTGALVQWKLTARAAPAARPKSDTSERPTHDD
jgi:hypothetical protein